MTGRVIGTMVILLTSTCQIAAQTAMIKWHNPKNEEVLTYHIDCMGQLYKGSKYTKWKAELVNTQARTIKCEAVMVNKEKFELSEALVVTIDPGEHEEIIFIRANAGCDESPKLNFNHFLYRKTKRGL
ncbi:MAG: hypothetical protein MI921_26565 [Cytophagales bacterium]|nr:hypothetical protein [Cytophagales bacterium]